MWKSGGVVLRNAKNVEETWRNFGVGMCKDSRFKVLFHVSTHWVVNIHQTSVGIYSRKKSKAKNETKCEHNLEQKK
jgi:hypothetical protein